MTSSQVHPEQVRGHSRRVRGSAFDKGVIGNWSADYINEFVQYKATDMLSRGTKNKIYDVFKNQNQETQIILSSVRPEDRIFMR